MPEPTFSIQKATKEDVPAIVEMVKKSAELHQQISPDYWGNTKAACRVFAKQLKGEITDSRKLRLVLRHNSDYIGYLSVVIQNRQGTVEKRIGYLGNAYMDENFRGYGLIRLAFEEICNWLIKKKVKTVEVAYSLNNPLSCRCWEGLGFEPFTCRAKMQLSELHKKSPKRRQAPKSATKSNSRLEKSKKR